MGMYTGCQYEQFAITDVGKFERRLNYWCKNVCMHGHSMLLFDKVSLRVGGEPTIEKEEGNTLYKVILPTITLVYISINESMCIMYKILENNTQKTIYNMPKQWEATELWLADR